MKKFNESYNKILKEGLLNRIGARMSGTKGYLQNIGAAFKGNASQDTYKQSKINSIATSSTKDMLNDFYKLGLIGQPTDDQIKSIASSISNALGGSSVPVSQTAPVTAPTTTSPEVSTPEQQPEPPQDSVSMSDDDWKKNFEAKGGTPDQPVSTTTTQEQPPKTEPDPTAQEAKIKAREAELGMDRNDPRFTLESLSNFNNLYRNLIG